MYEKRFPASEAHRLDDPARKLWLPAAEVIAALHLRTEDVIADLGAGTGYFSLPMAKAVGDEGKVYAVDAQVEMLALLRQKLHDNSVSNVELIHTEAESTTLGDACCSLVILANVWHEFTDRSAVIQESRRILRAGGRIAILDWRPDVKREAGPPLEHRIAPSDAGDLLLANGFHRMASTNVGRHSWLVQAEKLL